MLNKNLIYITLFYNENYIKLLYLLLESIYIYGELNENTDILIYTNTNFMNKIRNSSLYNEKLIFKINDTINNKEEASITRFDIFNFDIINNYNKILYLDTDIIVIKSIQKILDLELENKIYVMEEGLINSETNYWGKEIFENNNINFNNFNDLSAFSSGFILFNNCEEIKNLFKNVKNDLLNKNKIKYECYDQTYLIYHSFILNLYNNKLLNQYVTTSDINIYSEKIILHFAGGFGNFELKYNKMNVFMINYKDYTIYQNINKAKDFINKELLPIILSINEPLEGNIFMKHHTTNYTDEFIYKQKNISNLLLNKNIKNVIEIGFNAGFSTLLMLISNPNIHITCVDLNDHKYTIPCYMKLQSIFGNRITFISGNSVTILPYLKNKYDLIHIDGGHDDFVAINDIINSYYLSKNGTIFIMDDYDFPNLHKLWNNYINIYKLKPLNTFVYPSPHHDIKFI